MPPFWDTVFKMLGGGAATMLPFFFTWIKKKRKQSAEALKTKAETTKIEADTEKVNAETEQIEEKTKTDSFEGMIEAATRWATTLETANEEYRNIALNNHNEIMSLRKKMLEMDIELFKAKSMLMECEGHRSEDAKRFEKLEKMIAEVKL